MTFYFYSDETVSEQCLVPCCLDKGSFNIGGEYGEGSKNVVYKCHEITVSTIGSYNFPRISNAVVGCCNCCYWLL